MLTRVQIKDFRCLRDVDVPLKPLTVLIGPNNTGKSAFLVAVDSLSKVPTNGDHAFKVQATDLWGCDLASAAGVLGVLESGNEVTVQRGNLQEPKRDGQFWIRVGDNSEITPLASFNSSVLIPSMKSPGAAEKEGVPQIANNVSNVPAFLDALLRKDRDRFDRIVGSLRSLIPGLINVNIETPSKDNRRIDLVLENKMVMEAELASHGVKMMIFFVALANHPNPPKTILIEEPETGVHPKRLEDIVKLLRGLSHGNYADHATQVILSTHSPYLLDYVDPRSDQVLVFERSADSSRTARPVDTDRLSMFLDDFMLGEVWTSQEEGGIVEKSS